MSKHCNGPRSPDRASGFGVLCLACVMLATGATIAIAGWRNQPDDVARAGASPLVDRLSFTGDFRYDAATDAPNARAEPAPPAASELATAVPPPPLPIARPDLQPAVAVVGANTRSTGATRSIVVEPATDATVMTAKPELVVVSPTVAAPPILASQPAYLGATPPLPDARPSTTPPAATAAGTRQAATEPRTSPETRRDLNETTRPAPAIESTRTHASRPTAGDGEVVSRRRIRRNHAGHAVVAATPTRRLRPRENARSSKSTRAPRSVPARTERPRVPSEVPDATTVLGPRWARNALFGR